MNVLQVSKFYPPVMGGIESVAWELAEGLCRAGVTTSVLCSHQRLRGVREQAAGGYPVLRSGCWGMLLSTSVSPSMPWHLAHMAAGADIVHLHMPDPMAAAAFRLINPRSRLVVHWHSDVIRQRRALKLYEPLQSWLLGRADAIVATSPPYAESSAALRPWRHKVAVVPIGISDNQELACSEKAARLRQRFRGRRLVFALGRMTYYKGFDVLIQAAARLPDDTAVLIGGDGELLEHYRTMVNRLGLAGKVYLPGHIHDADLPSHFAACEVFCMPSTVRAEAYGVAMVEAMVMGKPIVASDIPGSGVPWVNQHGVTGINVPVGQPEVLGDTLSGLLADDERRGALGAASRQRYLAQFRAEQMSARMLDLYRSLLPS